MLIIITLRPQGPGVSGEGLKSVVDGPRLHLPRLTSQLALDNSCGSSGRWASAVCITHSF